MSNTLMRQSDVRVLSELVGSGNLSTVMVRYLQDLIIRLSSTIDGRTHEEGDLQLALQMAMADLEIADVPGEFTDAIADHITQAMSLCHGEVLDSIDTFLKPLTDAVEKDAPNPTVVDE